MQSADCCEIHRRSWLTGAGALAAGLLLPRGSQAATVPGYIDTHRHLGLVGVEKVSPPPPNGPLYPRNAAASLEEMDRNGVAMSIISQPSGLVILPREQQKADARAQNEAMAKLVSQHPTRYGFFAAMPMPYVDDGLAEIAYALDVLKADGIQFQTSYADNSRLADKQYEPLLAELNRRKAVVYTHPNSSSCCQPKLPEIQDSMIEYGTDTTRLIARLLMSGATVRYPDIKFIFSHAGGTFPYLIERFTWLSTDKTIAGRLPNGLLPEVRKLYFDVAQANNIVPLSALRRLVPNSQILLGTDFPYHNVADTIEPIKKMGLFSPEELAAIGRGNALRLLGRAA